MAIYHCRIINNLIKKQYSKKQQIIYLKVNIKVEIRNKKDKIFFIKWSLDIRHKNQQKKDECNSKVKLINITNGGMLLHGAESNSRLC